MHLKAYAVDGRLLRTGSGNFSRPGLSQQDNDLVLISDPAAIDAFERISRASGRAPGTSTPSTRQSRLGPP